VSGITIHLNCSFRLTFNAKVTQKKFFLTCKPFACKAIQSRNIERPCASATPSLLITTLELADVADDVDASSTRRRQLFKHLPSISNFRLRINRHQLRDALPSQRLPIQRHAQCGHQLRRVHFVAQVIPSRLIRHLTSSRRAHRSTFIARVLCLTVQVKVRFHNSTKLSHRLLSRRLRLLVHLLHQVVRCRE
jgi:hypothetical protein